MAIRARGGAGAAGAPTKGLAEFPEDLFVNKAETYEAHLEVCEMCREEYDNMVEFIRHYMDSIESASCSERFDSLMARMSLQNPGSIELHYKPYSEAFEEEPAWAAATEKIMYEPMRFCSSSGPYMIREFVDDSSGISKFYLLGENGVPTEDIKLIIDGRIIMTGKNGLIDLETAGLKLSGRSKVEVLGIMP